MRTSLACTIPAMPSLIVRRYWMSASTNARGSNAAPARGAYRIRDDELRMRLDDVVLLDERLDCASFQFTGSRQAYHHSVRSDSTFHASRIVAKRLDALAQRRRVVVEVDPRAPAPRLAPHRHEVDVVRARRLCSANVFRCGTSVFVPSTP